jgi:hypothetical protein
MFLLTLSLSTRARKYNWYQMGEKKPCKANLAGFGQIG